MKKEKWEKEYMNNEVIDCPHCSQDRPDHSCGICYADMSQQDCWQWKGYCSQKCLIYITEELPRRKQEKVSAGINCTCDDPQCSKCLLGNCTEDSCPTHTLKLKSRNKNIMTTHAQSYKPGLLEN